MHRTPLACGAFAALCINNVMKEIDNTADLLFALDNRLSQQEVKVIGVDGIDGSGKTTLANEIVHSLGLRLFSIDDFLKRQQGSYLEHIRFSELKSLIDDVPGPIVLEGICLLHIAEQISLDVTDYIYIKQVNEWGFWIDEETCNPEEPVEETIECLGKEADAITPFLKGMLPSNGGSESKGLTTFREQVIRYHAQYRPWSRAHYIYRKRST